MFVSWRDRARRFGQVGGGSRHTCECVRSGGIRCDASHIAPSVRTRGNNISDEAQVGCEHSQPLPQGHYGMDQDIPGILGLWSQFKRGTRGSGVCVFRFARVISVVSR